MTREEVKAKLVEVEQIRNAVGLQSAVLFFQDPVTNKVDCRVIYAHEYLEVLTWIEDVIDNLPRAIRGPKPNYAGYINSGCPYIRGRLFPSADEE